MSETVDYAWVQVSPNRWENDDEEKYILLKPETETEAAAYYLYSAYDDDALAVETKLSNLITHYVPFSEADNKAAARITPGIGHNARDILLGYIDRLERLAAERKALQADTKAILDEAKEAGFNVKILRLLLRIRSRDPEEVAAEEDALAQYRTTIG